jgi:long-chain fatty acid transport protein
MKRSSALALAIGLVASTTVHAAGIERSAPTTRALFEEGRYLEFSTTWADPDLSGRGGDASAFGGPPFAAPNGTGDIFDSYATLGFAFKADIGDRFSYAIIFDQPWGVDTTYPSDPVSIYQGVEARLDANQLTGILAYDATDSVKVYGGVRVERISAEAAIPFVGGYRVETDTQTNFGYLVGAAYQIPEIAFRVGLTYYSSISHDMNTTETSPIPGADVTRTKIATPQSVNLDFQSGIAASTLLYGSIRWVDWSEFSIEPPRYPLGTLVDYEKDWTTYTLGLGRQFNETWGGFVQASYEPSNDTVLTTLGPVDGRTTLGLGGTYTRDSVKVTAGVSYTWLGDAENPVGTQYRNGDAIGVGVRVGYSF